MTSSGNKVRRSSERERDDVVIALLRSGKTTQEVAAHLGCSGAAAWHICERVRKSYGAPNNDPPAPGKVARNWRKLVSQDHAEELAFCERHLGRPWVAEYIGAAPGPLDDDQHAVVALLQLHAALLCELRDGEEIIEDVRERLAELSHEQLHHVAESRRTP